MGLTAAGPRVVVIGGGASGVLLAAHLLRLGSPRFEVTIVERRDTLGRGVAYATPGRSHLLNVRAANMSAFADQPGHFWTWAVETRATGDQLCPDPFCFVRRSVYGRYLSELLAPWRVHGGDGRLRVVQGTCVALDEAPTGVRARLDVGLVLEAELAVLATGHSLPEGNGVLTDPWARTAPGDPSAPVLMLGTGLSMVDVALALEDQGQRGPVVALSRRGLLPEVHARNTPQATARAEVPVGAPLRDLTRWLRAWVAEAQLQGGDWRDVVDGLRPHVQAIWGGLSLAHKRQFLRHVRPWWDVHRHRMPPESAARLTAMQQSGQLRIVTGHFLAARADYGGVVAQYRPRRQTGVQEVRVDRIVDCRGILRDPGATAGPLERQLLAEGLARIDPLRLGLDVAPNCAVRRADGAPSTRIFGIGPVTRPLFWEVTAVPDIRVQAEALAQDLAARWSVAEPRLGQG